MSFYQANLAVLKRKNPQLAARLSHINVKNVEVFPAKSGQPTLRIQSQGREQLIHSQYDPVKEASQLLSRQQKLESANFIFLLGVGLGYPLFELVRQVGWEKHIFVIEPQMAFFKLSMESFDLRPYFLSPNITFYVTEAVEQITAQLTVQLDFSQIRQVAVIEHPVSIQIMADYFTALKEALRGVFVRTGGNLLTLMTSATEYQMNTLANLDEILKNPPVKNLFGKFAGKPAVLIGAGPSLDKNAYLLREISDKAVLISVETALKSLLARGIKPHLVIAADPLEDNYQHLVGVEAPETYLVAEPMTYPAILHNYQGRKFVTTFKDVMMEWLAQFVGDLGFLRAWGSISTMGFDLARNLGCDPIIMVGQDLSFSGKRKYCHHTHWEESWLSDYEHFQPLDVIHESFITIDKTREAIAIDGQKVVTNQQLYAYRKWFEEEIKNTAARCFNATEGGVLLAKGLELISLKEAIFRFCQEPFPVQQILAAGYQQRPPIGLAALRSALNAVLQEMNAVRAGCLEGQELAAALKQNKTDLVQSEATYKKLNEILLLINEQKNLTPFLIMANQKGHYRFKRASAATEGKVATPEILEQTATAFKEFYQSILLAIDFMRPNFSNALAKVPTEKGA